MSSDFASLSCIVYGGSISEGKSLIGNVVLFDDRRVGVGVPLRLHVFLVGDFYLGLDGFDRFQFDGVACEGEAEVIGGPAEHVLDLG